jgi:hypothetical protein
LRAQLFGRRAHPQFEAAFDVGGGERLAVVPFDTLAQLEGQLGGVLAPRPVGGQIGDDRFEADLLLMLVEQDKIVENAHHRPFAARLRFLEERQVSRVASGDL